MRWINAIEKVQTEWGEVERLLFRYDPERQLIQLQRRKVKICVDLVGLVEDANRSSVDEISEHTEAG